MYQFNIQFPGKIIRRTQKAILVQPADRDDEIWLPKSATIAATPMQPPLDLHWITIKSWIASKYQIRDRRDDFESEVCARFNDRDEKRAG